jgi:hypothetical protein
MIIKRFFFIFAAIFCCVCVSAQGIVLYGISGRFDVGAVGEYGFSAWNDIGHPLGGCVLHQSTIILN